MQLGLIPTQQPEIIPLTGGELWWYPNWLSEPVADRLLRRLRREVSWQQSIIRVAGRATPIPRLNAWYGDRGYRYSGVSFRPQPWNRPLAYLRERLHRQLERDFTAPPLQSNSALVNCYRDGRDSVAWHADDEPELGPQPQIASVSLGATRRFLLKPKRGSTDKVVVPLSHGSLLLMLGDIQRCWVHALPKTRQSVGERLNITFREVID